MNTSHVFVANLATLSDIPEDGILSRTLHNDEQVKVVYFGFATGEELSDHTASMPALIQIVTGRARLTLGGETYQAGAGAWAYMPAQLPHSVYAEEPTVLLLTLLKNAD